MVSPGAKTGAPRRRPGDYFRWLKVYGGAARVLLRGCAGGAPRGMKARLGALRGSLVLTQSDAQETLLAGFPGLVAVPEELFGGLQGLLALPVFPRAGSTEEEKLAAVRDLERASGQRFDWDAFLTACERRNCRSRVLLALAESIRRQAAALLDTSSARAALGTLVLHRKE